MLFQECNRDCEGCCNKDWDLDNLDIAESYKGYEEIILTGGEPMLRPFFVRRVIKEIRRQTDAPIYLYTAKLDCLCIARSILSKIDGITVTLHEQNNVEDFKRFNTFLSEELKKDKYLRLNVFKNIDISGIDTKGWQVKNGIVWIKNCPLPKNEEFKKCLLNEERE